MHRDAVPTPSGLKSRFRRTLTALDSLAQREWRWIIVIAWLLTAAYFINHYSAAIHYFSLADTDDNMRYLQVHDWLAGQSWWDLRQHRMAPPDGANIHWSRLVDLPIAALMLFFRLFTSDGRADELAVAVAPLLPLLVLMLSLAFIARRLASDEHGHGWFIAMLLPLCAAMGLSMYMPLRIDHHGWQLALTTVALAGLVDRKWTRGGLIAGVASAASVVIGMEMLVYLAGAGALIALRWIFKEGAARRLRPYALGLGGTSAIGYALFASNANRAPVCDAISPVWASTLVLSAGTLYALTLLPLRNWIARLLAAAIGGLLIIAFAWINWPQCVTDIYGVSAELQKSWLVYIREAKPIYVQPHTRWVPMIALPAIGFICALIGCWSARRDAERLWAWATVTLMITFAIALTFWQIRAGPAAQLLAIPPIAWAGWTVAAALFTGRPKQRALAVPAAVILILTCGAYYFYPRAVKAVSALTDAANSSGNATSAGNGNGAANMAASQNGVSSGRNQSSGASSTQLKPANVSAAVAPKTTPPSTARSEVRCRTRPALAPLDQLPPATIFTMVDLGPRLIAITKHSVIAGPYHRNSEAILDVHHAFDGSPERFREIARKRGASYLLYCPNFPEGTIYQRRSPNGFYARLVRGESFPFLTPVKLNFPGQLPYQLYRIEPLSEQGAAESPSGGKKVSQKAR
jgi:hypothetical protein